MTFNIFTAYIVTPLGFMLARALGDKSLTDISVTDIIVLAIMCLSLHQIFNWMDRIIAQWKGRDL